LQTIPIQDRFVIARALQGLEPQEAVGVSPLAAMMAARLRERAQGGKAHTGVIDELRGWFGQPIVAQLFDVDPHEPPPVADDPAGEAVYVPNLPKGAMVPEGLVETAHTAGHWLNDWMSWSKTRAPMTDPLFLESAGLWLMALTVARRIGLNLSFGTVFPNLYVWWVAGTTVFHKSTGLRLADMVARRVVPQLLLASNTTPEMLFHRLAGGKAFNYDDLMPSLKKEEDAGLRFAGQRGFIKDEASALFGKDYLKGLPELLMDMYECPDVQDAEFKSQGKLRIESGYLSLMFATTPSRLQTVFGDGEWEDGLLSRFALLTPSGGAMPRVHATRLKDSKHIPNEVLKPIFQLHKALPEPQWSDGGPDDDESFAEWRAPAALAVEITDGALAMYNRYEDALSSFLDPAAGLDTRLRGTYGRNGKQMLKVAQLLAAMDWASEGTPTAAPVVTDLHMARAQGIAESWRASAHRLLAEVSISQDKRDDERVLRYLKRQRGTATTEYRIWRGSGVSKAKDAAAAIKRLYEAGEIMKANTPSGREGYVMGGSV